MAYQDEIRKRVTNEIISALRGGTRPWSRPWCDLENTGMPTNLATGNRYSGVNVLTLLARNYSSKYWGTFNQLRSLGLQVKKRPLDVPPGAFGTRIIFFKPITKTSKNTNGEDEEERFLVMREFVVFNVEQCSGPGIEEYLARPRSGNGFVNYEPAEVAIAATGADIRFGGSRAFYCPEEDYVQLPPKEAFSKAHEYYGTCLHELVHYTGHEDRLNRLNKLARFGSESYAVEEMCAEIGASFLCAELGIPSSDALSNSAAYLANWLRVLERDHTAIFTAATAASKAADYILSFSRVQEEAAQEEAVVP